MLACGETPVETAQHDDNGSSCWIMTHRACPPLFLDRRTDLRLPLGLFPKPKRSTAVFASIVLGPMADNSHCHRCLTLEHCQTHGKYASGHRTTSRAFEEDKHGQ